MQTRICANEAETTAFAGEIATQARPGQIYLLNGVLGAGKSVFARGFIRSFMNDPDLTVPSPTFNLVQTYENADLILWHYDLYRLKEPDEVYELSWEEALSGGIVLIEWPERLQYLKPAGIVIDIEPGSETDARKITVHGA